MNNENNNLNGTVLGNVSNEPVNVNPQPINPQPVQNVSPQPVPNVNPQVVNGQVNPQPMDPNLINNQNVVSNPNVNPNPGTIDSMIIEPTPQVQTPPSYTNPNTIVNQGMPGFDNSAVVGTTPPISLEPDQQPKKKSNKLLFIIIILLVLAGVGFGTYYLLTYTDLLNKNTKVTIETKELEFNVGDTLPSDIDKFATITGTDSRNCNLDNKSVDMTKAGNYQFTIKCGESLKVGKVSVVDNAELVVETKSVYKIKTDTVDVKEFISNIDNDVNYEFVDENAINTILTGTYDAYPVIKDVKIKATATSGKTAEVNGKIVLLKDPIKGFYICDTNEEEVSSSSAKMTTTYHLAISGENNDFSKIAKAVYKFKYSDKEEYNRLKEEYNTNNKLTVNSITGNPVFDDANSTITFDNELDSDKLIKDNGEANMENYRTISNYYKNELKYNCRYEKSGE